MRILQKAVFKHALVRHERRKNEMIWYPYEQMKTMKTPYKIVVAEEVYLYT